MNNPARRDGTPDRNNSRDNRGARSDAPRGGRSEAPRGARSEAPRGGRSNTSRSTSGYDRNAGSDRPRTDDRRGGFNDDRRPPRSDDRRPARTDDRRGGYNDDRRGPRTDDRRGPRSDDRRTPHVDARRAPRGGADRRSDDQRGARPDAPRGGAWSNAPRGSKFDGPPRKRPAAPTPPATNKRGKPKTEKPQRVVSQNPLVSNAKPARHQHAEITKHDGPPKGDGVRLQKVLAQAGVASRRAAEELIDQGRVEVDGRIVVEQGLRVDPENAVVRVDGVRVVVQKDLVYLAMNKPRGWQCTMSDDLGRPCVGDIVS